MGVQDRDPKATLISKNYELSQTTAEPWNAKPVNGYIKFIHRFVYGDPMGVLYLVANESKRNKRLKG